MKTYELVGVTKISYKDKQSGQPRTLTRLSLVYEDPAEKNLVGKGVKEELVPDFVFTNSAYEPTVGDLLHLFYEPDYRGNARLSLIEEAV